MAIGERMKELRNGKGFTQTELAKRVGLTYIQIGRYENGKSKPSSEVLQKIAGELDTTADYLMNGMDDIVTTQLQDKELYGQFKAVEKLSSEDKHLVKTFIDAFITKREVQKLAN
jgi:transcriptional regulator with XRE-family HTH domain